MAGLAIVSPAFLFPWSINCSCVGRFPWGACFMENWELFQKKAIDKRKNQIWKADCFLWRTQIAVC